MELMKSLIRRGIEPDRIRSLIQFIDWLMYLPPEQDLRCYTEMNRFSKERHMQFVSMFEREGMRRGMEKGIQQGIQQGKVSAIKKMIEQVLATQYGPEGRRLVKKLNAIEDGETLQRLSDALIVQRQDLDHVRELLK